MNRLRIGGVITVVAAMLGAQSQTTFYGAYADAQAAIRRQDWLGASRALGRAIQLRPAPAARVITYGNNLLTNYYPYSLLARCQLELGHPETAAALLQMAEARGEPQAVRDPVLQKWAATQQHEPARNPDSKPVPPTEAAGHDDPAPERAEAPRPLPEPPATGKPITDRTVDSIPPAPPGDVRQAPPVPSRETAPSSPGPSRLPPAVAVDPEPGARAVAPPAMPAPAVPPALPPEFWAVAGVGLGFWLALVFTRRWRRRAKAGGSGAAPSWEPRRVGPYQIIRSLGCGSFATTYLARHGGTGREVALKLLHPHRLQDPEFCQRFVREARVGARLDHPGLVAVLEAESSWIAMEYVAGPTLAARLREARALTVAEATGIALGIAEAMAYAHAHGVVHRDLKPANVILAATGPKVADLGIVRELDAAGQTTTLAFLGTPLYAAPEAQALSGSGPPADGYSLGAILFEMLDGHPPFRGGTPFAILEQHRSAPVPDLRLRNGVPPELASLVEELLAKDPDQRPKDAEVVARLRRVRAGLHLSD